MDPSTVTSSPSRLRRSLIGVGLVALAGFGVPFYLRAPGPAAEASTGAAAPPAAVPVSVASVEPRQAQIWDDFSGRLEAVERVEIRSRVAGAVQALHFSEGELVRAGDLLVTIDPAPFVAEVQRAEAQVAAAQARVALAAADYERGQRLFDSRTVSLRDLDTRLNAHREAQANQKAAEAALQSARLNLGYTEVRAPVSGRVGRREITVGNLVAAGPGAAILTNLVSVSPIYASFNADENAVLRALQGVQEGSGGRGKLDRIPVQMTSLASGAATFAGRLQLIDNQVDPQSGTVRVRAVFENQDGSLMPGQFARLRMGQAKTETLLMVDERAIGTDQDKKFVLVVGADNKALYRAVTLGPSVDGLRIVTEGLQPGERIVVNGLQRVRPGALVQPQVVAMGARPGPAATPARLAQR
ncbi:efflux RND transporter periplasmic adaptor subunit [uncultured Enterovirga sp.]|uniref:efflux RND transporter periplasmic adaptor subunit n=1 Tax=uncultured Enterovirga sp. TaxID=2026352 RepID=UPI0035CBE256